MNNTLEKPVSYLEKDQLVSIFDRMSKKQFYVRKWEKIGRGNTSISSMDGTSFDRSYVSFLYEDDWYSISVDDSDGIQINKIKKQDVEKHGPLLWLNDGTKSNW